jgi:hypothetical protein
MARKRSKRVARTKTAARSKTTRAAEAKAIRKILALTPKAPLDAVRLLGATRAQLLEVGRALRLRGRAGLRKRELVDRILTALGLDRGEPAKRGAKNAADSLSPGPRPRSATEASPSASTRTRTRTRPSIDANIPWGYGRTHVGALPVDPDRLFVYWEVTDDAVDRAREALGTAGTSSPLILRLYDTTGRLFDGTNARSCFDQEIDDSSRQRFFDIGKPGSEAFVEIGLRSADRFVKLARSSRVAFPRREPVSAPVRPPQWLTVRESTVPSGVALESPRPSVHEHFPTAGFLDRMPELPVGSGNARRADRAEPTPGARPRETEVSSLPFDAPERAGKSESQEPAMFEVDGRTHVVFGPWQVVVRGANAGGAGEGNGEKRVVSQWTVYRSWAVEGTDARMPGGRWGIGSSARGGASELRLSGASETLYRGASERRLGGASDRRVAGASERRLGGASGRWPARTAKSTRND